MRCVAPQTRKFWAARLHDESDDQLLRNLQSAENGVRKYARTSNRHQHDWTIYRACCIRELRRRGLAIPPSTL